MVNKKSSVKKSAVKKKPFLRKLVAKAKKPSKKKILPKKSKKIVIGEVIHYFPHVKAAVVKLKTGLCLGDEIHIKGHTSDFKQSVSSIQLDLKPLKQAKKGQEIGLLVSSRVRHGDMVYKA